MSELTLPPAPPTPVAPTPAPPRRRGLLVGAIVTTLAVIAGAVSFVATQGGERAQAGPLALVFTEGDTQRFRIEQTMELTLGGDVLAGATGFDGPLAIGSSQLVTWRVTEVDEDGVATVRVSVEESSVTVDGMPLPSQTPPPVDLRISPAGRIVSIGGPALGGAAFDLAGGPLGQLFQAPGQEQMTPLLPPGGDARPGDTWDTSYERELPIGEGSVGVEATSRYARADTVDGIDVAVVETDADVTFEVRLGIADVLDALTESGLPATGATGLDELAGASIAYAGGGATSQTSWLSLDEHEIVRSETSGEIDLTMELAGVPDMSGTFTIAGTFTQEMSRA